MNIAQEGYQELRPPKALQPYVNCFWTSATPACATPVTHRVLPDGCIDFIFDFSPGRTPEGKVVGTMTRPLMFQTASSMYLVAVRFQPGGATPFLGLAAHDLTDLQCELPEVWRTLRLTDRLCDEPTRAGKIRLLESSLLEHLAVASPLEHRVLAAVTMIKNRQDRIEMIAGDMGLSRQHLTRLFQRHVGVGPKVFARVIRLQSLLDGIKRTASPIWAAISLESGYYDQAHMVNECRDLTGLTPTELAER